MSERIPEFLVRVEYTIAYGCRGDTMRTVQTVYFEDRGSQFPDSYYDESLYALYPSARRVRIERNVRPSPEMAIHAC